MINEYAYWMALANMNPWRLQKINSIIYKFYHIKNIPISVFFKTPVFNDPYAKFDYDSDHSNNEDRFILIGYSYKNRLLFVAYTDRGDKKRIISSRLATKKERMLYENKNKN